MFGSLHDDDDRGLIELLLWRLMDWGLVLLLLARLKVCDMDNESRELPLISVERRLRDDAQFAFGDPLQTVGVVFSATVSEVAPASIPSD